MEYTRLTNLEVTGHLKVAGQEVTPGGGGSSTLSGLTDVDISNPTDGQTLVYNATSGKWENGAGGGGDMFVTLGTISAATVPMSYNEDEGAWVGIINTDIDVPDGWVIAGRDLTVTIGENTYSDEYINRVGWNSIDGNVGDTQARFGVFEGQPLRLGLQNFDEAEPVITNLSVEVYALTPDLAIFFNSIM